MDAFGFAPTDCPYCEFFRIVGNGDTSPNELTNRVIGGITAAVRNRLGPRLELPPSHLGFSGPSWADHFRSDGIPEIVVEYFRYLLEDQLAYLHVRALAKWNIAPLIEVRFANQFLFRRQRDNDPIEYAMYANVRAAVDEMVKMGHLQSDQIPRLNNTPVRFPDYVGPVADHSTVEGAVREDRNWSDLYPLLSRVKKRVQRQLRERFATFPQHGVRAFTAQVVSGCLRAPVRIAATREQPLTQYDPERGILELFRFRATPSGDTRSEYLALFRRLRQRVRGNDLCLMTLLDALVRLMESEEVLPETQAELARRLGFPANRLSEWGKRLHNLMLKFEN